ncbi:PAS and ANTAR domain-containing protein [Arthrobacter sp. MDT1-48-3]
MQSSNPSPPTRRGFDAPSDIFENCPTGTFQYIFATDTFHWSDEMFLMHGYEPGEIVPTYELGQSHVHPSMRESSAAFWAEATDLDGPLSAYLTLQDRNGKDFQTLVVGGPLLEDGERIGVWGLLIDLTHSIHADSHRLANEAVAASVAKRSTIDQAKGILAGRMGISLQDAFDVMSQHSQDTNRKVNAIAQDVVEALGQRLTYQVDGREQARKFLRSL